LHIVDGDSLVLDVRGSQYRIDLWGIDAPERKQPWGKAAADRLNRTLTGRFVNVRVDGGGDDGRIVGRVMLRGRDIGLDLLHDGLAWSAIPGDGTPQQAAHPYNLAQRQASIARRGLWSDDHPVPPWEWRDGRPEPSP
jgi:endonuclease YncB( thermonuclease family)